MVPLIILLLVLLWVVLPIGIIVKLLSVQRSNDELKRQVSLLEVRLNRLHESSSAAAPAASREAAKPETVASQPSTAPAAAPTPVPVAPPSVAVPAPVRTPVLPAAAPVVRAVELPPPLPVGSVPVTAPTASAPAAGGITAGAKLPPAGVEERRALTPAPAPSAASRVNWEQFIGAKGFAWLGGLALLLGVAFFVKYSFEHNLIPADVRMALGYLLGAGLIVGGLTISRARYAVTAETLCATGAVCLYTVTFACNSIYHFAFFGPLVTFALMALITATAFLLAVRLEARVVAVLGMLGGFLTPVLLSTGVDNPPGLFGYIALLDVGLIAVALFQRWGFLVPLGAAGTVLMLLGWTNRFFAAEKAPTAVVVILGFCALFFAAHVVARRRWTQVASGITASAVLLPAVALGYALFLFGYPAAAARPGLIFTFVLLADGVLLALAWLDEELSRLHLVAGLAVFGLLAIWTVEHLTSALLPWALTFYLLHAVLHTAFPLVLQRRHPSAGPTWWSQLFPPLALLLMLGPLWKLDAVSLLFWPCLLLVDTIAIGLALVTASLLAVGVVLVFTLVATGLWIFQVPASLAAEPSLLLVVGLFAVLFFAAGLFLARKLRGRLASGGTGPEVAIFGDARAQLPAFAALLPFLLLIMMTQRLPLADPSPVFGLALLLVVLTLGLARLLTIAWLPACALAGVAGLEYAWHERLFAPSQAGTPLAWYLGFTALFAAYPFVFRRRFAPLTGPWAVAALAGLAHFPLVYRVVKAAWPNDFMGVLPALFAVPPLLSLLAVLGAKSKEENPARLNQLAWFGGAALAFITLIFPIQFDRQWITLGWAGEGVALLWLFHRVPHPGLRATGFALLAVAFARLALNPAVLHYHLRGETAVFNWYLYSYGLVTLCLFAGARLLAPPRERILGSNAQPLLNALGIVLAFLLLNIEIADFFSAPGQPVLTFQFSGIFARDMSYTIAWALFALGLLLLSIWRRTKAGRYAAIALLGAALLKLFLHDLSQLGSLYRIGALFAVAVIAILASFAYQRFLPGSAKHETPPS
jgi:uncharacterized membrane protein